ncbi:hypothetical protein DIPPA_08502 [Diplonema papillatum]|nr:hypothetical protein DIPPA_08502 [Diplonema papillatum]|eukprot:gene10092-15514_t
MSDDATVPFRRFLLDVVDQDWAADGVVKPDDLSQWLPPDPIAEESPLDALQTNKTGFDGLLRGHIAQKQGTWNEFGLPLLSDDQ